MSSRTSSSAGIVGSDASGSSSSSDDANASPRSTSSRTLGRSLSPGSNGNKNEEPSNSYNIDRFLLQHPFADGSTNARCSVASGANAGQCDIGKSVQKYKARATAEIQTFDETFYRRH